ncbi:MAG: hypothetical protein HDR71_15425 [Lachnospiraceae bacterium]|nr:hypothetical protein [Lachnospiraceae bacterium]
MAGKPRDLTNMRFGKLIALERVGTSSDGSATWECVCDCGKHHIVASTNLVNKKIKSCGCLGEEYKHSRKITKCTHMKSRTRLYGIWKGMKKRCYNRKASNYCRYGARGITVCDDWKEDYSAFEKWALQSGYEEDLTIDRINNNGNYSPGNCRWATKKEQSNNKECNILITLNGESKTAAEWSTITGVNYQTIVYRFKQGMKPEEILACKMKK